MTTNGFTFDTTPASEPAAEGRAARPRTVTLLDDVQRGTFLSVWDSCQTGFVADPRRAAENAERLVGELAASITRRIGEITESLGHLTADDRRSVDDEAWQAHLLRCREAFHLLIDS